jgi:hypothetical protein
MVLVFLENIFLWNQHEKEGATMGTNDNSGIENDDRNKEEAFEEEEEPTQKRSQEKRNIFLKRERSGP